MNVISRYGKAPVSDFGAPSGIRNFQEMFALNRALSQDVHSTDLQLVTPGIEQRSCPNSDTHTHTIGFLDMRILSFRAMAMSSVVISLQVGHELPNAGGDGFGLHLRHCQEQLGRVLLQDSHKTL